MVAGGDGAEVNHHHVPPQQDPIGRAAVRQGTSLPGGHDGFEGWTVGSELAEGLLQ